MVGVRGGVIVAAAGAAPFAFARWRSRLHNRAVGNSASAKRQFRNMSIMDRKIDGPRSYFFRLITRERNLITNN
jgi:hypothetical protein